MGEEFPLDLCVGADVALASASEVTDSLEPCSSNASIVGDGALALLGSGCSAKAALALSASAMQTNKLTRWRGVVSLEI